MIFDHISNASIYENIHLGLAKGLALIRNTDFDALEDEIGRASCRERV